MMDFKTRDSRRTRTFRAKWNIYKYSRIQEVPVKIKTAKTIKAKEKKRIRIRKHHSRTRMVWQECGKG